VTIITPPTHNKPHETRKPPPYRPLLAEPSSQDNCESLFTPVDGLAGKNIASHFGARNRYDRLAPSPLWSMTAFKAQPEENLDELTLGNSREVAEKVSTSNSFFPQSSLDVEQNQPLRSEPNEGSPGQNGLGKRSEILDQVPDIVKQRSESLQDFPISGAGEESVTSGVPTRSASQEHVEEGSTPDTEDYFSRGMFL